MQRPCQQDTTIISVELQPRTARFVRTRTWIYDFRSLGVWTRTEELAHGRRIRGSYIYSQSPTPNRKTGRQESRRNSANRLEQNSELSCKINKSVGAIYGKLFGLKIKIKIKIKIKLLNKFLAKIYFIFTTRPDGWRHTRVGKGSLARKI